MENQDKQTPITSTDDPYNHANQKMKLMLILLLLSIPNLTQSRRHIVFFEFR